MKSCGWFTVLVVFFVWSNIAVDGAAIIGRDACNCQPSLIRTPKISIPMSGDRFVLTKTPGSQVYAPINDACGCVTTRVTLPAASAAPAPDCGFVGCADGEPRPFGELGGAFHPTAKCGDGTAAAAGAGSPVVQDAPGPDGIDEPATGNGCCDGSPPAAVAVDPVSLILAQAEANRCRGNVREDRLAFGQVAVPKDALPARPVAPDVNEEGLYALDKAIVELKTCKRFGKTSALASDTDALLALEEDGDDDAAASAAGPEVQLPSYADVGYRTETPYCAPLVGGVSVPPAAGPPAKVVYEAVVSAAAAAPPAMADDQRSFATCVNPRRPCSCAKCCGSAY